MPWPGSTGTDNVAADFRTSRVPSEYKRVVGASLRKCVMGLDSTHAAKRATKATTMINIILNGEWFCASADGDECPSDADDGLLQGHRSQVQD